MRGGTVRQFQLMRQTMTVYQTIQRCCITSSTLRLRLHLTILHDIKTQTTAAPLL